MLLSDKSVIINDGGAVIECLDDIDNALVSIGVTKDDVVFGIHETNSGMYSIPASKCVDVLKEFGVPQFILARREGIDGKEFFFRISGICTWMEKRFESGVHEFVEETPTGSVVSVYSEERGAYIEMAFEDFEREYA
jgi:hypothetical protein